MNNVMSKDAVRVDEEAGLDEIVSMQEFQAAHERIFEAMDRNKDGPLTLEEMQAFIEGMSRSVTRQ